MSVDKTKCPHCQQAIPQAGGIVADRDRGEVRFRGTVAYLPSHEMEIFALLLERVGRVVSKDAIMTSLYQLVDEEPEIRIVDVLICKIRKKLRTTGLEVRTHWGRGYSLEPPKQTGESHDDAVEDTEDFERETVAADA